MVKSKSKDKNVESAQESRKERPESPKTRSVGCCDFRVLATGTSTTIITALRAGVDLDLSVDASVTADSSSIGANPPQPAASSSDSDGDNKVVAKQLQDPDLIGKADALSISWEVVNARAPVVVDVHLSGQIDAHMPCAPAAGSATFSSFKVIDQSTAAQKEKTSVVVTAWSACDETDRCEFEIEEP